MDYWSRLRNTPLFTALGDLPLPGSSPAEKVGDEVGRLYSLGLGWFAGYTERRFDMLGAQRVENGEPGTYVVKVFRFAGQAEAEARLRLPLGGVSFSSEYEPFEIVEGVRFGAPFQEVSRLLRSRARSGRYYSESDAMVPSPGEPGFVFGYRTIRYDNLELYFFGKAATTPLAGFQYNLQRG